MEKRALDSWRKFPVTLGQLCIPTVLRCGQSFRWKNVGDEWSCAFDGRIISLKQDPTHLHFRSIFPPSASERKDDTEELLRDYFNLSVDLVGLYESWSSRDPHFKKKAPNFMGVRILRQDPWENLVSFICSTNNNIQRISQMVEKLCVHYGPKLGEIEGIEYFDFPAPEKLAAASVEQKLRDLGFGYRAKYIAQTARVITNEKSRDWLNSLRTVPYREAHESLLSLAGVGPKVADCVCLMSLDKSEAVPVDTHVWQIAQRDYKFGKGKHKSLTAATYIAIGDHFRELWGNEAGWAHSVLFTADLRSFSEKAVKVTTSATDVKVRIDDDDTEVKLEETEVKQEEVITERKIVKRKRDEDSVVKKEEIIVNNTEVTTSTATVRRSKRLR